jgi:cyclic pyranopterin phosphate synthase
MPTEGALVDPFGRVHTYLRVSVTDRCNFRCTYCMPEEGLDWTAREDLLTYEEIERIVRIFVGMGVRRVRLTGGEPTVRRDIERLVQALGALGLDDLTMTTNGHLFGPRAADFAAGGLRRINLSLDALDPELFRRIARGGEVGRVLAAIDAALEAGLQPVKINMVVMAGINDHEVEAMVARFAPLSPRVELRFIEYMPFGHDRKLHLPARELRARLDATHGLEALPGDSAGGPATRARLRDSGLVVGFISPITEHFCDACNRLRLLADGALRTCLSREDAPSLRDLARAGADDLALELAIRRQVWGKVAGHEADGEGASFKAFEGVMTRVGG